MSLTNPQPVQLLQTGDIVEGESSCCNPTILTSYCLGAGFDNWLDAVDGSFCTFEGGDDPEQVSSYVVCPNLNDAECNQDGIYPDPLPGGFKGECY